MELCPYEPGLKEIIKKNVKSERLYFSDNISSSIEKSGHNNCRTPQTIKGHANMTYIDSVVTAIKHNLKDYKIICTKVLFNWQEVKL